MADTLEVKPPGIIRSWSAQLQGTLKEPDGKTPSSARLSFVVTLHGIH
jgi:hypothetical protein